MRRKPLTAVMPEIVLVTDMRGVWRAGTILHSVWQPTMYPKENLVDMLVKAPLGELMPSAMMVPRPPVQVNA